MVKKTTEGRRCTGAPTAADDREILRQLEQLLESAIEDPSDERVDAIRGAQEQHARRLWEAHQLLGSGGFVGLGDRKNFSRLNWTLSGGRVFDPIHLIRARNLVREMRAELGDGPQHRSRAADPKTWLPKDEAEPVLAALDDAVYQTHREIAAKAGTSLRASSDWVRDFLEEPVPWAEKRPGGQGFRRTLAGKDALRKKQLSRKLV